ncbi:hypothetical protein C3L33_22995, partial [Rhododendron williamsianum]
MAFSSLLRSAAAAAPDFSPSASLFRPSPHYSKAYMFKYDSTHGVFKGTIKVFDESTLEINGKQIKISSKRDPAEILWGDYGAEYVVESSGIFTTLEKASIHKKVSLCNLVRGKHSNYF